MGFEAPGEMGSVELSACVHACWIYALRVGLSSGLSGRNLAEDADDDPASRGISRRMKIFCAVAVLCLVAGGFAPVCAQNKNQTAAMTHFEMQRYIGRWYEIARLPDKAEKQCVSDGIVLYAEGDKPGRFQFVAACRRKDDSTDSINKSGRAQDKSGDGRLQLRPFWPFWTKYWVFAVGPNYEWALAGTPNHHQLWVLSRQTALSAEVLAEIETRAAAEGFDPGKLIMSPQSAQRALAPADSGR